MNRNSVFHLKDLDGSIFSYYIEIKSLHLENGSKIVKYCLEQEEKRESMGSEIINLKNSYNNSTYSPINGEYVRFPLLD